jgi:hypothetical protein
MIQVFKRIGAILSLGLMLGIPIWSASAEGASGLVPGIYVGVMATLVLWIVGGMIVVFLSIIFGWED